MRFNTVYVDSSRSLHAWPGFCKNAIVLPEHGRSLAGMMSRLLRFVGSRSRSAWSRRKADRYVFECLPGGNRPARTSNLRRGMGSPWEGLNGGSLIVDDSRRIGSRSGGYLREDQEFDYQFLEDSTGLDGLRTCRTSGIDCLPARLRPAGPRRAPVPGRVDRRLRPLARPPGDADGARRGIGGRAGASSGAPTITW